MKAQDKFNKIMSEWEKGKLRDSHGKIVSHPQGHKQALSIAFKSAREINPNFKREDGGRTNEETASKVMTEFENELTKSGRSIEDATVKDFNDFVERKYSHLDKKTVRLLQSNVEASTTMQEGGVTKEVLEKRINRAKSYIQESVTASEKAHDKIDEAEVQLKESKKKAELANDELEGKPLPFEDGGEAKKEKLYNTDEKKLKFLNKESLVTFKEPISIDIHDKRVKVKQLIIRLLEKSNKFNQGKPGEMRLIGLYNNPSTGRVQATPWMSQKQLFNIIDWKKMEGWHGGDDVMDSSSSKYQKGGIVRNKILDNTTAKPVEFEDVTGEVNYMNWPEYFNELPVITFDEKYQPIDYFTSDIQDKVQGNPFIGIKDNKAYYIDPQGYNYSRYVSQLINFKMEQGGTTGNSSMSSSMELWYIEGSTGKVSGIATSMDDARASLSSHNKNKVDSHGLGSIEKTRVLRKDWEAKKITPDNIKEYSRRLATTGPVFQEGGAFDPEKKRLEDRIAALRAGIESESTAPELKSQFQKKLAELEKQLKDYRPVKVKEVIVEKVIGTGGPKVEVDVDTQAALDSAEKIKISVKAEGKASATATSTVKETEIKRAEIPSSFESKKTETLPVSGKMYLDIENKYNGAMRNELYLKKKDKLIKDYKIKPLNSKVDRIFLENSDDLELMFKVYNEKRAKKGDSAVDKSSSTGMTMKRGGRTKGKNFVPVKKRKTSVKNKVNKSKGSIKKKLDDMSEGVGVESSGGSMATDNLTLKQHDIAETLKRQYDYVSKEDAIKYIKNIFGSTANLNDIVIAYNSIDWDSKSMEAGGSTTMAGGTMPNNYAGKKYSEVWDSWSHEQKKHFLLDHLNHELMPNRNENAIKKITSKSSKEIADIIYSPNSIRDGVDYGDIHNYLISHVGQGQYSSGGSMASGGEIVSDYLSKVRATNQTFYNLDDRSKNDFKKGYNYLVKHKDKKIKFPSIVSKRVSEILSKREMDYLKKIQAMKEISHNIDHGGSMAIDGE